MKKNSSINNGLFNNVTPSKMEAIRNNVVRDSRIQLWSWFETLSKEEVPVAEALVAYDSSTDTVVKFIAAFIPPYKDSRHQGIKFLISEYDNGEHKPMAIHHTGKKKKLEHWWNPNFQVAYLDYSKLPALNENAEFRVLRAYRAGIRTRARFELLAFPTPAAGQDVQRNSRYVEAPFNSVPPIRLAYCHKKLYEWQKRIINEIGMFSGVDLGTALGLGIKHKLDKSVKAGLISNAVVDEILHDHSEDPIDEKYDIPVNPMLQTVGASEEEFSESIAESFGVSNMEQHEDEEGRDYYVPPNPLLKTMPEKEEEEEEEEEEELVDLYD
jgi:hypothetical protein